MTVFRSRRALVKFLGDVVLTACASWMAVLIRSLLPLERPYLVSTVSLLVYPQAVFVYALIYLLASVYDDTLTKHIEDESKIFVIATIISAIVFAATIAFTGNNPSRVAMLVFYVLQLAFCYTWRLIMRRLDGRFRL
jgi:FlaA1/EpsC-like NDP-sugar epimerase